MNFVGLNLTVPHKLLAFEMMDVLDDSAKTWGAVNTVRFEAKAADGQWLPLHAFPEPPKDVRAHGFNTDADAILRALREDLKFEPRGKSVLLLGAGGAGRVAALKLAQEGAKLYLVNRTVSKAEQLAAELKDGPVTVGYPHDFMFVGAIIGFFGGPSLASRTLHATASMRSEIAAGACP